MTSSQQSAPAVNAYGANPYAGEVALRINGETLALKLTLGALATLETRLGTESLIDLVTRFESGGFSAADVLALLAAGLQGGGHRLSEADLAAADIDGGPMQAARTAAQLLARSFALPGEAGAQVPGQGPGSVAP
ncbi:gene transfer agent family protein [Phaeobacter inhibens]|uniref:gene transfer agent family protein n=1 Tax=Phaeobacter inhibens TaxID=221822 RepID=UPI0021A93B98|nr:gene transfer agent family protein [Phaeobacter inhibens]UWR43490.1 gene transfer agent family protein [Phaeobacter inhibens]